MQCPEPFQYLDLLSYDIILQNYEAFQSFLQKQTIRAKPKKYNPKLHSTQYMKPRKLRAKHHMKQEIVSGKLFLITVTYTSALQNMYYQTE
jgi:hypothetical protein